MSDDVKEFEITMLEKEVKSDRNSGIIVSTLHAIVSTLSLTLAAYFGMNNNVGGTILELFLSACFATSAVYTAVGVKQTINEKRELIKELKK